MQLIQLLSTVCSVPSPRVGFGGPSRPNKAPSPPIETWSTIIQRSFCQILDCQVPLPHKCKPPLLKTF